MGTGKLYVAPKRERLMVELGSWGVGVKP